MKDEPTVSGSAEEAFRLRDWTVHPTLNRIERPSSSVHIEPKHMDVLVYMARHSGEIQSKERILEAVWPQQYVAESALTRAIAELRRALDDDARNPRFIETIPKRGYRLIANIDSWNPEPQQPRISRWWIAGIATIIVVGAVTWYLSGPRPKTLSNQPSPAYRQQQVTTSSAFDIFPNFSPDGLGLIYSSDRSGSFELYVRQLTPGAREIALTDDGQNNLQPSWSPDGSLVAYHSIDRGGIWLLPSMGGQSRQLTAFGANPTWSPDGTLIAFESHGPWLLTLGATSLPLPGTIWIVQAREGAQPRQLTWEFKPRGGHVMPTFSPDGKQVFFSNKADIWSVDLDGGSVRQYRQPGSAREPVVSRDGETLYYIAWIQGDYWLSSMRLVDDDSEQQALVNIRATHLCLSPDGKRFAMSLYDSTSNLWQVPLDPATHQPVGPASALINETNQRNTLPSFSPDGELIVFNRLSRGTRGTIWTISADGSEPQELYSQVGSDFTFPQWTQDGRSLYLNSSGSFHQLDVETLRLETLSPFGKDWQSWSLSPDGTRVAFSRTVDAVTNIWVVDAGGDNETQITFHPEYASYPTWSPDGKWINLQVSSDSNTYLAIVPSTGGEIQQLTFEPEHSWGWGWSADQDKIAFAGSRNGEWNVWWVSVVDGTTSKLTDHKGNRGSYVRYPSFSPKGDQVVYELSEFTADIWFVDLAD